MGKNYQNQSGDGKMGKREQFGKTDKKFLSKNKRIKLYKEKVSRINVFKQEVELLTSRYQTKIEDIEKFKDLPLSDRTKRALKKCDYIHPTQIQKETILLCLQEHDLLGAAKTGSGKTLAFVIPLLERLYVSGWSILDGLGALIITPTRELAYQIYEVINKVGCFHQFSVGLIIGGKDLAIERKLLDKCNIMICTPGRLLQHMDENPLFDAMNLKLLILDEADRILDLGFQRTMNAILENLPQERQTLLFSATQTKSVKDLARLSLKNPVYVSVDEHAKYTTPEALQQSFLVCEAHDKMNLLWSFIKSHKKQKILVFMASCKQVKFTFESICRLRPGVSIMSLYGSLHQLRRMQIYDEFCKKNNVVMFATDIAARGLDFPNVNWVVQLDCPEDVNTYIHRAGRTARYEKDGESLLVLLPSEKESMIKQLTERKIPIEEIKANPSKLYDIKRKLEAILSRDKELKESGVRAFKAYLKSIYLMKDKTVFDVSKIDANMYANSLGMDFVPRIRFLEKNVKGFQKPTMKNKLLPSELSQKSNQPPSDEEDVNPGSSTEENATSKFQQLPKISKLNCDTSDELDIDLLLPKEQDVMSDMEKDLEEETNKPIKIITKAAAVKKALKSKARLNTIIKFDEEGNPLREVGGKLVKDLPADIKKEFSEKGFTLQRAKILLEKEEEIDRQLYKEKIKSRHRTQKMKEKERNWLENPSKAPPTLNNTKDDSDNDESSGADVDPNNMSASEDEDNEQMSEESSYDDDDDEQELSRSVLNEDSIDLNEAESSGGNFLKEESSDEEISDVEDDIENIKSENKGIKRKKHFEMSERKKRKSKEKIKIDRTVEDDEALALHFLTNS